MERIKFSTLHLENLKRYSKQGTNATLYIDSDGVQLIKVLDRYTIEEKKELFYKGWEMKDLSIDGVLFPHTLYVEEDKVEAYAIHHLTNSETLYDYYHDYSFFNFDQMLHSFKDASLILRRIHENKIVGGDINFDNILIDQNDSLQYIDVFDSCHFGSFCSANFVSLALYNFMTLYRRDSSFDINENTDRISFLLAIRSLIANKSNTIRYFIELKQKETIQNVETYISLLKGSNRYKELPEVPYFDELIEESNYSVPSLFPNKIKNKKM